MPIPELQLVSWSHRGSVQQSAQTYETIKNVLNDSSSPYHSKDFTILLQGSYGNHTNVYKDSDVDIVIRLNQTFYSDLTDLEPGAKENFNKVYSDVLYGFDEFKAEVLSWLRATFGSAVNPGRKAIFIRGNGNRRNADVLVCARLRRYRKGSNGADGNYDEGICFFLPDKTRIVNFPEQHSEHCTAKHQATNELFKPVVRVYKNMRNRMVDEGAIKDGLAPSYFLEGMLWNVPPNCFGASYGDSFVNTFNWILKADKTKLVCANDLYWLVRDNAQACWPTPDFDAYLSAARKFWEEWKG